MIKIHGAETICRNMIMFLVLLYVYLIVLVIFSCVVMAWKCKDWMAESSGKEGPMRKSRTLKNQEHLNSS